MLVFWISIASIVTMSLGAALSIFLMAKSK